MGLHRGMLGRAFSAAPTDAVVSYREGDAHAGVGSRWHVLLAVGGLLVLYLWGLGGVPLLDPDEGRYAEIPREMLATGDFITPRLNGVLYFEKPPLHYWAVAAGLALLPSAELGSRLPGALLALAGLATAYLLGRSCGGRRAGAWAAVVLGTSPLYVAMGHVNAPDMTVSFFMGATLACFWFAHRSPPSRWERWLWWGMFVSSALAVLAKGLIGVVIPGAVVVLYLSLTSGWSLLRRVPWISGTLLFFAVAAPWHVAMALRHRDFLSFYFIHEHLLRYATRAVGRWQPVWFYGPVLLAGSLPWCGLLPGAPRRHRPVGGWRLRNLSPELVFFGGWMLVVLLFFSFSSSKLIPYILPALLPLAVLTGAVLSDWDRPSGRARAVERATVVAATSLLVLLVAAMAGVGLGLFPHVLVARASPLLVAPLGLAALILAVAGGTGTARGRTWGPKSLALAAAAFFAIAWVTVAGFSRARCGKVMAAALESRLAPGERVVAVGDYPQTIPFYSKREIDVAGYMGELYFGVCHLPADVRRRRFPTLAEFTSQLRSGGTALVLADRHALQLLRQQGVTLDGVEDGCGDFLLARASGRVLGR